MINLYTKGDEKAGNGVGEKSKHENTLTGYKKVIKLCDGMRVLA